MSSNGMELVPETGKDANSLPSPNYRCKERLAMRPYFTFVGPSKTERIMMGRTLMFMCCVGVLGLTPIVEAGLMVTVTNVDTTDSWVFTDTNSDGTILESFTQTISGETINGIVIVQSNSADTSPAQGFAFLNQSTVILTNNTSASATYQIEVIDDQFNFPSPGPAILSSDLTINPLPKGIENVVAYESSLDGQSAPTITLYGAAETAENAGVSVGVNIAQLPFTIETVSTATVAANTVLQYDATTTVHAPEPGTLAFMGLGGLGMVIAARRRRKAEKK